MPFMGPILTRISEKIKVPLTYLKNIQKYNTADSAEEKMRRNRKKYKTGKKNLKPSVPNHLIATLMYLIEYL